MSRSSIAERQDGSGGGDLAALRGQLHAMWEGVAPGWAEHAAYSDRRGAALAEHLLDLTAPRPGERVLELACGPGGLGLAAAERVVPGGEVVVSRGELVEIGTRRLARVATVAAIAAITASGASFIT